MAEKSLDATIAAAAQRLETGKKIADEMRHDPRLHRLSMETVFVLEDTLVALKSLKDTDRGAGSPDQSPLA